MQDVRKSVLLLFVAAMVAAMGIVPAHAQEASVSVNIPFDFVLGKQHLSMGKYTVQKQGAFASFRGPDGRSVYAMLLAGGSAAKLNGEPRLVFTRYGNESFLNHVVFSADRNYSLPRNSREKKLRSVGTTREQAVRITQPGQ